MSKLQTLLENRAKAHAEYEAHAEVLVTALESRSLTDEESARKNELRARVVELDALIDEATAEEQRSAAIAEARVRSGLAGAEAEIASSPAVVKSEPRTYGDGSDNSYFADKIFASMPGHPRYDEARARQESWGKEVVRDSINDPALRARAVKATREHFRKNESTARKMVADLERRAMDTTGSSGGSFVTPDYLVSDWAPYRTYQRSFIDQTNKQDLPDYGMTVYLPHVTAAAGVAAQSSQNTAIDEADPTAGYLSSNLETLAGVVTVSQQLLDRAGPGVQFDQIIFQQLAMAYNTAVDTAALTAALANAGTITDATSGFAIANVYGDIAKAANAVETSAGVVLPATHVFFTPTWWNFLTSQLDSTNRPLILPTWANPWNSVATAEGNPARVADGATGYEMLSMQVFKDGNIPTTDSGAETQVIVAHMPEVWVWEGAPVTDVLPQTLGADLSVLLRLYAYNTVIVRYPTAVQSITGAQYPVSPTFA